MIGHKIVLPKTGVDRIVRLIEYDWRGLVVDHDESSGDAFIYKGAESKEDWDHSRGMTEKNRDQMIYVLQKENSTTLVVDEGADSETRKLGERIQRLALQITESMPWAFLTADLYGDEDDERLSFDSPEDWVERAFDDALPFRATKEQVEDTLDGMTLECVAFVREVVSDAWVSRQVAHTCDIIEEGFDEDYGDPDEYGSFSKEVKKQLRADVEKAIRAAVAKTHVWRCREVAKYTFEEEEIRRILGPEYLKGIDPVDDLEVD